MHSSRMRTVRCSSRLLGRGCLPGGGRCVPLGSVSQHARRQTSPVDRIIDTRSQKHYLSATLFADGKNYRKLYKKQMRICLRIVLCLTKKYKFIGKFTPHVKTFHEIILPLLSNITIDRILVNVRNSAQIT